MIIKIDPSKYSKLCREDFDAIVTGELTHFSIWLEDALVAIIADYFARPVHRIQFLRVLMLRDGLTFQDKIEIVRAIVPEFEDQEAAEQLRGVLVKVEAFKSSRNAFAHGHDITPHSVTGPHVYVEIVNRVGKEKTVEVTPESHVKVLFEAKELLNQVNTLRSKLNL